VLASSFFGSISGSVVSNVLTTGAFTIPAMKKTGYPAHYAAAVETNASSGGMLLPPVMGSSAFIMARWLGIPYVEVCAMAAIPSVLYFFAVMMQTDAYAAKMGLKGLAKELVPSLLATMKTGWFYGFAFVLLVFFLAYLRLEGQAPFYAILMLLALAMIRKETRLKWKDLIHLIEGSGKILVQLVALFAGISMIVGALVYTGVATTVAGEIMRIAGGNVILVLIFSAIVALILGTGMQGASVYILLALMLAPALTAVGFYPPAVHLFLMYFAMLSFITPPVAMGAYAAAGLAGCSAVKTSVMAMRLGAVTYFLPFFFLFNPAMIAVGSAWDIFLATITAVLGIIIVSGALEGYMWGIGKMIWPFRIPYAAAGMLLLAPDGRLDIYGGIVLVITVAIHLFWKKVYGKTPKYAT
jgi:TRAP transporter 4TM/12TM fusion protein